MKILLTITGLLLLSGCTGSLGDVESADPVLKGASYIASAIVTHGVLQIIFRK